MKHRAKIETIIEQLNSGEFLQFRNYAEEHSNLKREFWEIVCMILISSKKSNESEEYYSSEIFQLVLDSLFDQTFLNRVKTNDSIGEIPRKNGLNRAYWEDFRQELYEVTKDQKKIYKEAGLILHQSITSSLYLPGLIERSEPKMISVYVFDKWHRKLDQSVSSLLRNLYPPQLITEYDDDVKLTTAVSIKKEFVKSYHQIATDMMISKYIASLIKRIDVFFNETDFPVYSEDLLVQDLNQ